MVWTGRVNRAGYGQVRGKLAHRLSWELHRGPIPKGQVVRHLVCDNPPCINPDHLALGTHADNSADRRGKPLRTAEMHRQMQYMLRRVGFPDPKVPAERRIFVPLERLAPMPHFEAPEALLTEVDQLRAEIGAYANRNVLLVWLAILGLRSLDRREPQLKLLL